MDDAPAPVVRHAARTTDPDEADGYMQAYTRFRAEPTAREGFEFGLHIASADPFAVSTLRHTARFRAQAAPPDELIVSEALDGTLWVTCGREESAGALMLVPSRSSYLCGWANVRMRMTTFDRGALLRVAAGIAGCAPGEVTFGSMNPRSAALARYWSGLTGHVERHLLADDGAMASPLLRGEALRSLAAGLLTVFPNSTLDHRHASGDGTGEPAAVRRAVEFIDAHAGDDIDLVQIADAARIGPRGLMAAFRTHRGQTPLEYLRRVRMEGAHRDLQAADPTCGDTVAPIAARWGFGNPGRFAVEYARAYGCPPSETLRR